MLCYQTPINDVNHGGTYKEHFHVIFIIRNKKKKQQS